MFKLVGWLIGSFGIFFKINEKKIRNIDYINMWMELIYMYINCENGE